MPLMLNDSSGKHVEMIKEWLIDGDKTLLALL